MNKFLLFISSHYSSEIFWFFITLAIVIGFVLGFIVNTYLTKNKKKFKFHLKLEKAILWTSSISAFICLLLSLLGETTVSIQILSFYVSFIFAWLLTKTSSQNEFKRMQHKVAKNTYRHIEDVETSVLLAKKRVESFCDKLNNNQQISAGELEGIVDSLNSILTGIRSNKDDWKDMLKKRYKKKIKNQEDPEGRLEKLKSPASSDLKKEFKDEIQNHKT